jgi:hypothetical protein
MESTYLLSPSSFARKCDHKDVNNDNTPHRQLPNYSTTQPMFHREIIPAKGDDFGTNPCRDATSESTGFTDGPIVFDEETMEVDQQVGVCNNCSSTSFFCFRLSSLSLSPRLSKLQGRIMLCLAAAIYGSDFVTVKLFSYDNNGIKTAQNLPPLSCSIALRFTIAATAVIFVVIVANSFRYLKRRILQKKVTSADNHLSVQIAPTIFGEQLHAVVAGGEIGIWYCIGYIFQALGLSLVDSTKVSVTRDD